jgi:ethanolamine permease
VTELRRTLGPVMLWGLGVGYVISGEYFGWNLGLEKGGSYGMLAATLVITVMYLGFILSYAELACAIPRAGGAFVYCDRAFGPKAGLLAGVAQLVEFVFAPPAIAMAIAAYVGQRYPELDQKLVAIGAYAIFTGLNAWGVRQAVAFELVITVLAVGELLLFVGVVGPSFSWSAFSHNALPNGWGGAVAAVPFAIWFYLAIEGVANAAEEARDPQRTVALGFGSALLTLVVLALLVFFAAVGVAGWEAVVYAPGTTVASDAPLPLALAHVVDKGSALYTLLLGVGLLGLIASFHGIILAASRATMALAQAGYGPAILGRVHPRTATPVPALLANMAVGVVAILSGKTAEIITLSCFGAVTMYIVAMLALFRLRQTEPELPRPFRAVLYPWGAGVALVIAVGALGALATSTPVIAAVFVALLLGASVAYALRAPARA